MSSSCQSTYSNFLFVLSLSCIAAERGNTVEGTVKTDFMFYKDFWKMSCMRTDHSTERPTERSRGRAAPSLQLNQTANEERSIVFSLKFTE